MAGSFFGDLLYPEPDERDLPLTALARQLGVWIPPDPNSSELPFAALARSLGVTPLTTDLSGQAGQDQSYAIPVADKTSVTSDGQSSDRKYPDLTYPDGTPVIDPSTNKPYPRPPNMDVPRNLEFGRGLGLGAGTYVDTGLPVAIDPRELGMAQWFMAGAPFDYKRPHGIIAAILGDKNYDYRHVTYYNYGSVAAAAGYSREEALEAARSYNRIAGSGDPDLDDKAQQSIGKGWDDAHEGRWSNVSNARSD